MVVLQSGCLAFPAHYDFQDSVLRLPVIIPAPQAAHAQSKLHVCVYIHLNWAVRILYSRFEWHLNLTSQQSIAQMLERRAIIPQVA